MNRLPAVHHLIFPNQYLVTSTLLRFQEHYESPRFRGETFTLEDFMDWYAAKHGGFTYFTDWNGFNFPSWVLEPFMTGGFDPLTRKERAVLQILPPPIARAPYYVIATHGHGRDTGFLAHECMHAMFYVDGAYRASVLSILGQYRLRSLRDAISEVGYHAAVVDDESNAFATTGLPDYLLKRGASYDVETSAAKRELQNAFVRHFDTGRIGGIDMSAEDFCRYVVDRMDALDLIEVARLTEQRLRFGPSNTDI